MLPTSGADAILASDLVAGSRGPGVRWDLAVMSQDARMYLADSCFQWWSGDRFCHCPVAQPSNAKHRCLEQGVRHGRPDDAGLSTGLPPISRAMVGSRQPGSTPRR
jgi:hypothetical protein